MSNQPTYEAQTEPIDLTERLDLENVRLLRQDIETGVGALLNGEMSLASCMAMTAQTMGDVLYDHMLSYVRSGVVNGNPEIYDPVLNAIVRALMESAERIHSLRG